VIRCDWGVSENIHVTISCITIYDIYGITHRNPKPSKLFVNQGKSDFNIFSWRKSQLTEQMTRVSTQKTGANQLRFPEKQTSSSIIVKQIMVSTMLTVLVPYCLFGRGQYVYCCLVCSFVCEISKLVFLAYLS
jgi:hypothetical protein